MPNLPPSAVALGIDVGSTALKCVAVAEDGSVVWSAIEETAPRIEDQVRRLVGAVTGLPIVATGYGRKLVARALDLAVRPVTEITCHARGVVGELSPAGPGAGALLVDIGGQDSKAIVIGANGAVVHFAMNDKCAAGTGRFLENTARRLGVAIAEMGPMALGAAEEHAISSTCTVFAESEVVSLVAQGAAIDAIVRGLHRSLVRRVAALAKSAGRPQPLTLLSGGVAQNEAVAVFLAEELSRPVRVVRQPALTGAYGAALTAAGLVA